MANGQAFNPGDRVEVCNILASGGVRGDNLLHWSAGYEYVGRSVDCVGRKQVQVRACEGMYAGIVFNYSPHEIRPARKVG
jgi:hypothetical protein